MRWLLLLGGAGAIGCFSAKEESSKELIPAEWTIFEDTSAAGEVITGSLQLPASREIAGLAAVQPARLILRCLDNRVEVFIDAVQVQLDSTPSCE